jgi:3-hydroxyacyl-CoA dehydrogenase
MDIRRVGVVGGGVMGAGIVQTLSSFDCPVYFKDVSEDLARKCMTYVEKIYASALKKEKLTEQQVRSKLSLITSGTGDDGFADADLVIEAVPEKIEVKRQVFASLDKVCKPGALLATNTSSLSISQIASFTNRSSQVIGVHWFNPAHVMKLVEVIPGLQTSEETLKESVLFCRKIGKVPVQVRECAGFLVNRLLGMYMNEALFMFEEQGVPEQIDQAALLRGMPMGPLRLGDMVGWDVIYHSNRTLVEEYGVRFALPPIFSRMIEEGRLGQKVGHGVYPNGSRPVDPDPSASADPKLNAYADRLIFGMLNEGIRCLEEGVASAGDIDAALQLGTGMPKGPLAWADEIGLDVLLEKMNNLLAQYGERFRPAPLLRRKAQAGYIGRGSGKGLLT